MSAAVPAYNPGDLSRLLGPSAGAPVVVSQTFAADPSFFGYLRPTKGRPPSRKAAKGGGKFSKQTLAKKAHGKKEEAKKQQERHKQEVAEAAARKKAAKEARSNSGRHTPAAAAAAAEDDAADAESDDGGMDESDGDEADDVDEAAIEQFMADIDADGADEEEAASDDGDEEDPEVKAKRERLAKRDARLAEDRLMDAPLPRKKDLRKQRESSRLSDPRLPRTIFVGNVPTTLKSHRLAKWIEEQLGVDSATQQSIVESVRYRSVAIANPKVPRAVAVQKGMFHEARDSLNAYVVFNEGTEATTYVRRAVKEINAKELEFEGKKWRVRVDTVTPANSDAADGSAPPTKDLSLSVFVGNLPFSVNENDLYAHFDSCGSLEDVRVVRDRDSNMGKGIAFLRFGDAQSMRNALAFNKTKFGAGERELRVQRAVENKKLHKQGEEKTKGAKGKKATAGSSSGGSVSSKKEGYGGVHKIKEVNQAGVLKKPRHKPRDGSAPKQQVKGPAPAAATPAAAAAAAAAAPAAVRITGAKRSFEGDHADPDAHIKRQKADDFKQRERKEKKRDQKKITAAPPAASHKK